MSNPTERLRHHVTGAVERGEADPITAVNAPLTLDDLELALADERHLGYGLAIRYQITNRRRRDSLERAVVRQANALGLDYEALFAWTNSKFGRYACDEATDPNRAISDIVAAYMTPEFVRIAQEV